MDLITSLSSALGVDSSKAQALAGLVMGQVQEEVAENGDPGQAAQVAGAVPELDAWKEKAAELAESPTDSGGGLMGGLMGAASSGLGQQLIGAVGGKGAQEQAQFVALVSKLGLQPSHAALAAPVVLGFLKERLGPDMLGQLLSVAPMLGGLQAAAPGGDDGDDGGMAGAAAGLLGKLF
ncbi:MAG: hypothetical protein ACI8PZ_006227 [Myxococcota bacterium]|jgi:hypothetical protein